MLNLKELFGRKGNPTDLDIEKMAGLPKNPRVMIFCIEKRQKVFCSFCLCRINNTCRCRNPDFPSSLLLFLSESNLNSAPCNEYNNYWKNQLLPHHGSQKTERAFGKNTKPQALE